MSTFQVAVQEPPIGPAVEHRRGIFVSSLQVLLTPAADIAGRSEVLDAFLTSVAYPWAPSVAFPAWLVGIAGNEWAKARKTNLVHGAQIRAGLRPYSAIIATVPCIRP